MKESYKKIMFDDNPGFRLHHTSGKFAAQSTTQYLHYEVELSFIYFIKGVGEIKIEGNRYSIEDGDLILLKPSELYYCVVQDGTYHERLVLYFNSNLLKNFSDAGYEFFEPFYKRKDACQNKISSHTIKEKLLDAKILELIALVNSNDKAEKIVSTCKTIEILSVLRRIILENFSELNTPAKGNHLVNDIITYINQSFSHNISLEEISKKFYMDKFYISRLFKEQVGVTVWNYVIFRRLSAFNDLIRANTSIEDAYLRVGFKNYSNFFRLYKKHMNMTPSEYKKTVLGKDERIKFANSLQPYNTQ